MYIHKVCFFFTLPFGRKRTTFPRCLCVCVCVRSVLSSFSIRTCGGSADTRLTQRCSTLYIPMGVLRNASENTRTCWHQKRTEIVVAGRPSSDGAKFRMARRHAMPTGLVNGRTSAPQTDGALRECVFQERAFMSRQMCVCGVALYVMYTCAIFMWWIYARNRSVYVAVLDIRAVVEQ